MAIDAFIASLAGLNLAARVLFAMGRDRGLPSIFGRSHSRYKSPWVSILFILLITFILGVLPGRIMDSLEGFPPLPQPMPFVIFMAGTATLGILGGYILVGISGLVFFQRHKEGGGAQLIWQILFPAIAVLIVGAALFSSIYPLPPAPPLLPPLSYSPYIFVGWLLLGIILVVALRVANPALVSKFGQIVAGEGESEESKPAPGD